MLSTYSQTKALYQIIGEQFVSTQADQDTGKQSPELQEFDVGYLPLELNGELALMSAVCG